MTRARTASPNRFPPQLIGALHTGDKRVIASEFALSGIGAGIVIYHGIRPDGRCTCGNPDCADAGKHPDTQFAPRGVRSATRDPEKAWRWFDVRPDHNIALALGRYLTAVDLDPRHGADLTADYGFARRTMTARSGGGGLHLLHRVPAGVKLKGGYLAPGVELRTGNQAIVIEKSRHRSGGSYEWRSPTAPIALLPEAVARRLANRKGTGTDLLINPNPSDFAKTLAPEIRAEVERVWRDLLRGKHREQARLLLKGDWEAANCPSQSEAEYNLILLLSRVTDDHAVWLAVLRASGLGKRDREGRRNSDGRGHKLVRPDFLDSLFARVAARRSELSSIGDPNVEPARHIFATARNQLAPRPHTPRAPKKEGGVIDARKSARGRPRGAAKRDAAMMATIRFLACEDVVRDSQGFVRLPVGEAAQALDVSRETLRQALTELVSRGIVESRDAKAYVVHGHFARDRSLRLCLPKAEALALCATAPGKALLDDAPRRAGGGAGGAVAGTRAADGRETAEGADAANSGESQCETGCGPPRSARRRPTT